MTPVISKEDLKEQGKEIAKLNEVETLFATSDGQFFLPSKKSAATLHKNSAKVELYELSYAETKTTAEVVADVLTEAAAKAVTAADKAKATKEANKLKSAQNAKTTDEKITEINALETIDAVENYIKGETDTKVLDAATARQTAIKTVAVDADTANKR